MATTAKNSDDASYLSAVEFAIANRNVEMVIYLVQLARVRLLDKQLLEQMEDVHKNNKKIERLNDVLSRINSMLARIDGNEAKSTVKNWTDQDTRDLEIPLNAAIKAAGITDLGGTFRTGYRTALPGESNAPGGAGVLVSGTHVVTKNSTKGELDAAITKVRSMIDSAANTQTLQMQRMQALTNKKNEAHETINSSESKRHNTASSILNK